VVDMVGAHALMRRDDVFKPDRVAGVLIKDLCVSKDLALSLVVETLIELFLISDVP